MIYKEKNKHFFRQKRNLGEEERSKNKQEERFYGNF